MRLLLASLLLVLVAGCSVGTPAGESSGTGAPVAGSNVDVDTPALRRAKAQAGIEPCRAADADPDDDGAPATDPLPDLTLPCLGGGPSVRLGGLRGPLVINLFAQWCEPCRDELPFYQRLHVAGGEELRVLGIDYLDTQPAGALALAEATGVTFPLLADPDGLLRSELRVRGLPGVVFVDADGQVTRVEFTVIRSYRQLTGLVAEHLGVSL